MELAAAAFVTGIVVGTLIDIAIAVKLLGAGPGRLTQQKAGDLSKWVLSLTGVWLGGGGVSTAGSILTASFWQTGLASYLFGSALVLLPLLIPRALHYIRLLGIVERQQAEAYRG